MTPLRAWNTGVWLPNVSQSRAPGASRKAELRAAHPSLWGQRRVPPRGTAPERPGTLLEVGDARPAAPGLGAASTEPPLPTRGVAGVARAWRGRGYRGQAQCGSGRDSDPFAFAAGVTLRFRPLPRPGEGPAEPLLFPASASVLSDPGRGQLAHGGGLERVSREMRGAPGGAVGGRGLQHRCRDPASPHPSKPAPSPLPCLLRPQVKRLSSWFPLLSQRLNGGQAGSGAGATLGESALRMLPGRPSVSLTGMQWGLGAPQAEATPPGRLLSLPAAAGPVVLPPATCPSARGDQGLGQQRGGGQDPGLGPVGPPGRVRRDAE